jgi:hypothetical protein
VIQFLFLRWDGQLILMASFLHRDVMARVDFVAACVELLAQVLVHILIFSRLARGLDRRRHLELLGDFGQGVGLLLQLTFGSRVPYFLDSAYPWILILLFVQQVDKFLFLLVVYVVKRRNLTYGRGAGSWELSYVLL